ncbi:tRNA lysidine(34) synthetase TilS [Erythrobacter sp. 3-20A1M]|uniref:tRNA lysidine(34) synthetase TilS n=1 Tax=Erythrobacter sp. 3-20A1M TaxID=2653850 RepID=UPI00203B63E9|nr:tRNA lysidine(34) synthetase TilS [Erythrobacter sp. 3-20A1M]
MGFAGRRLGLAVSGGPDSLALLLLAHAAMPGMVEAATVDHGLRPESADEAAMVAHLCASLGVPHRTLRVEVGAGNMHQRARAARYAALGRWLAEREVAGLATAHHADDQAETLLMRLNRGSGLAGLAGVRPRGRLSFAEPQPLDCEVFRPLLGWRREELEAVVAAAEIEPVRDPSNEDSRFERARVRAFLAGQDWLDPLAVAESARHLADAEEAIAYVAKGTFDSGVEKAGDGYVFRYGHPRLIEIEVVALILTALGTGGVPRSEIARMIERLHNGDNASLGGVLARREPDVDSWRFEAEPPRRSG